MATEILDSVGSTSPCIVMRDDGSWTITPYSPDMSPCDYDLFAKMNEPLRGTRYNKRGEIIHAVGRSLLDINRSGGTDGVWYLSQIWLKVAHMGGDYIEGM
jgi:hypothetical protein